MFRYGLAVAALVALSPAAAFAQRDTDLVRTAGGAVSGTITEMNAVAITVDQGEKGAAKVPVNEIITVQYADEPSELGRARAHVNRGAFQDALEELGKLELAADTRPEIQQDAEFYRAVATSRLALSGGGEAGDAVAAGKLMQAFVKNNTSSYHYLEANEVLGDLLAGMGRYDLAQTYYATLAKAPWPDYKLRARTVVGRSLAAQKKYAEALAEFDKALVEAKAVPDSENLALEAMVGKADALAQTGKPAEAVPLLEQVIEKAPPEATEVYARAYLALGGAYTQLKQPKDALLAYLHVHVLFSTMQDAHAEALANLAVLWEEINHGERAKEATDMLRERYPNSRFVKKP